jgi:RNA exonuclease NGL2
LQCAALQPSSSDFNFAPDDPAYSLLVGDPLLPDQEESLASSRVVHVSIDPSVLSTTQAPAEEEGNDATATDPDKTITNARLAAPGDGLLSICELVALFSSDSPLRSAYNDGLRRCRTSLAGVKTFGDRVALPSARQGAYEPEWTSYTHYWKTVLGNEFTSEIHICN